MNQVSGDSWFSKMYLVLVRFDSALISQNFPRTSIFENFLDEDCQDEDGEEVDVLRRPGRSPNGTDPVSVRGSLLSISNVFSQEKFINRLCKGLQFPICLTHKDI